jgi:hypothetical protein
MPNTNGACLNPFRLSHDKERPPDTPSSTCRAAKEIICMRGGRDNIADCGYNTWQQCVATARGLSKNQFWRGPREQPTTQGRSRQRNH